MRVLLLGGTGAMGVNLASRLAARGADVVVTSRRARESTDPRISFLRGDAHDEAFVDEALGEGWDAVVDFMVRPTAEFEAVFPKFLASCEQYVFVSSYRVYADSPVITEGSPRLLDVVDDPAYLGTDEYALSKARCEDLLRSCGCGNWTIVRPAVTYDGSGRFQLGVLEAGDWLWRALNGVPVPFPRDMLGKQATMSWGGDVAEMIARLMGSDAALGEAFTVSTAEHRSWREVADIYREVVPSLELAPCDLESFIEVRGGEYQIRYDRMFDRVVDNSKVLAVTGLAQGELTTLEEGLTGQLRAFLESGASLPDPGIGFNARMDRLLGGTPSLGPLRAAKPGAPTLLKYSIRRWAH